MTDTATAPETSTAETKDAPSKRVGQMPTYGLAKVSELPDNATSAGRSDLYFDLLSEVVKDPGEWYEVAHFKTPGGARGAAKAIERGERRVPDGEWEFETRRIQNPVEARGPKHSKLFARFMG